MTDTRPEHEQRQGIGPCDLCGEHGRLVEGLCEGCDNSWMLKILIGDALRKFEEGEK